jgi:poly-beta-1,6-N-acetyl-D-glucosamine synthase
MSIPENPLILFVLFVFILAAAIQLFYYLYFYLSVYNYIPEDPTLHEMPVSVIICARDEAENLRNFLPSVLEQKYSDYEVIVVNDCSEDNSYEILGNLQEKYPHLKVSTLNKDPKFSHNKKFAQFIGIKAAKNEILLFTDADCRPESGKWLEGMTKHFNEKTSFVLGYGGFLKKDGILNRYIRYDSITIAMQYLGMAIKGIPYMGVGRNLAYRRSVFFENKGFGIHNHVVSGDDDLFVNVNASGNNTSIEFRSDTHTRSVPCARFEEWFAQKKRHLSTARYYKRKDKILLTAEPASRILFYASMVVLLIYTSIWPYILAVFIIRLTTQIYVLKLIQQKLNETGMVVYSLLFDIFSPLMNSIVYLSRIQSRSLKNKWK